MVVTNEVTRYLRRRNGDVEEITAIFIGERKGGVKIKSEGRTITAMKWYFDFCAQYTQDEKVAAIKHDVDVLEYTERTFRCAGCHQVLKWCSTKCVRLGYFHCLHHKIRCRPLQNMYRKELGPPSTYPPRTEPPLVNTQTKERVQLRRRRSDARRPDARTLRRGRFSSVGPTRCLRTRRVNKIGKPQVVRPVIQEKSNPGSLFGRLTSWFNRSP